MTLRAFSILCLLLLAPLGGASDAVDDAVNGVYKTCQDLLPDHPWSAACVGQVDGGQPGDASNACADPSPHVAPGQTFQGWIAFPVDPEDNFALDPPPSLSVTVAIESASAGSAFAPPARHRVDVWAPASGQPCSTFLGFAIPGRPFDFTANADGLYTLRVVEDGVGSLLDVPETRSCHVMCDLQNKTGYMISLLPI